MFRDAFFASVAHPQFHQWMGNVFFRGTSPIDIREMSFTELKYFSGWHDIMVKEENKPT